MIVAASGLEVLAEDVFSRHDSLYSKIERNQIRLTGAVCSQDGEALWLGPEVLHDLRYSIVQ